MKSIVKHTHLKRVVFLSIIAIGLLPTPECLPGIGCPKCIVDRIPNIVPDTAKKRGIKRITIEKHPNFCIYRPEVKPANVVNLIQVEPDVFVMTGNAFAVQKALAARLKENLALARVPAIKNASVYSLTRYVDSSVIEYPAILQQWTAALAN